MTDEESQPPLGKKNALISLRLWLGRPYRRSRGAILSSHIKPSAIGGGYPFYGADDYPIIRSGARDKY